MLKPASTLIAIAVLTSGCPSTQGMPDGSLTSLTGDAGKQIKNPAPPNTPDASLPLEDAATNTPDSTINQPSTGMTPVSQPTSSAAWSTWHTLGSTEETPWGISGHNLIAQWAGNYEGSFPEPLGDYSLTISVPENQQVLARTRYDYTHIPVSIDEDNDGFLDGSVEVKATFDLNLVALNGDWILQQDNIEVLFLRQGYLTVGTLLPLDQASNLSIDKLHSQLNVATKCREMTVALRIWEDGSQFALDFYESITPPILSCIGFDSKPTLANN